jgi:hypothetical protein
MVFKCTLSPVKLNYVPGLKPIIKKLYILEILFPVGLVRYLLLRCPAYVCRCLGHKFETGAKCLFDLFKHCLNRGLNGRDARTVLLNLFKRQFASRRNLFKQMCYGYWASHGITSPFVKLTKEPRSWYPNRILI